MKAYLKPEVKHLEPEVRYLLQLISVNKKVTIELTPSVETSHFTIGLDASATFQVPQSLTVESLQEEFSTQAFANSANFSLSKLLYLVNSVQEYGATSLDTLGRFQYKNSYQHIENCVKRNLVQEQLDRIGTVLNLTPIQEPTRFCLTHDMDSVYGSIYEDGLNVIKKGRFDIFFSMLVRVAMGKPEWLNVDKIIALESSYDCQSIFFWIMKKAHYSNHLKDADYTFQSKAIQKHYHSVEASKSENALHKSISSSSFQQEIATYGKHPGANRYHYLKFNLPTGYDAIEEAGISLDFSLGFSEQMGFRNSYGQPFTPYNFKARKPYSFLEVPLHIMDRTFFQYTKQEPEAIKKEVINFFEMHRTNCVLSVLWHNNFFSDYKYKGYLSVYKEIMIYLKENSFKTIGQQELLERYNGTH